MPEAPEGGGIQSGLVDEWFSGLVVEYLSFEVLRGVLASQRCVQSVFWVVIKISIGMGFSSF